MVIQGRIRNFDAVFRKEHLRPRHFGLQREDAVRRAADLPDLAACVLHSIQNLGM